MVDSQDSLEKYTLCCPKVGKALAENPALGLCFGTCVPYISDASYSLLVT